MNYRCLSSCSSEKINKPLTPDVPFAHESRNTRLVPSPRPHPNRLSGDRRTGVCVVDWRCTKSTGPTSLLFYVGLPGFPVFVGRRVSTGPRRRTPCQIEIVSVPLGSDPVVSSEWIFGGNPFPDKVRRSHPHIHSFWKKFGTFMSIQNQRTKVNLLK